MQIAPTNNINFTSILKPIPTKNLICKENSVTIREATTSKDLTAVARAMVREFCFRFKLHNCMGKRKNTIEPRRELRSLNRTIMAQGMKEYLTAILGAKDNKTSIIMVEDKNNKNKVVGYAVIHTLDENYKNAIVADASLDYKFREPFGADLLNSITDSAKGLYDKIITRAFPIDDPRQKSEYRSLEYKTPSKEEVTKLNSDYPMTEGIYPFAWLEKEF